MSQTTIQLRQSNPDETEKMAQFESPDGDAICASYVSRKVADELGEYAEIVISDEASTNANLSGISGANDDGNYAVFETPGGAVTGLYVSHDALSEVTGDEPTPENAPESIGISFNPSTEDDFEEAEAVPEEEVEGLLGDVSDTDDSDDEEVEITDEELSLTE